MRHPDDPLFGHAVLDETPEGITVVRLTHGCSFEDVARLMDELVGRNAYRYCLYDLRGIVLSFTPADLRQIALYARSVFTEPNRVAWVTDSDLSYGLLRILSAYRGQEGLSVSRVFRLYENARLWLEKEKLLLDGALVS